MGSVANKIARKIAAQGRSKVIDLAAWREGKEIVREAGLDDDRVAHLLSKDCDPCLAPYVFGQNVASILSEQISLMKEAKGYVKTVGDAEDVYMPGGPPMSPLTVSYFSMWSLFDVRFGSSRETMGTCILRAAQEFDFPPWLSDIIRSMQQSRMGFYVHCGRDGELVRLREVGTQETITCRVPAGFAGRPGQIWFVRLLPPPAGSYSHHIVCITPYVIESYPEQAFVDYLERELARMEAKKTLKTDDHHGHLLKYGPHSNHWNEYILCAYTGHQHEAVFLTGIPDIRDSLPHAADNQLVQPDSGMTLH
ncbi:MAG: hypothetical protein IIB62_05015 [Proteobacteria bacterium]|nr:hypothetical protein [Pseudomonadota bacterium]